jgi:ElaB/YqjD/DUF883 family membrane-anchored ribosome-binding protein
MNKNGMADVADDKVDSIKDTVKGIVDQGAHTVDAVKSRVVDIKDQAVTRGEDLLARVADMVKANPLKAVAIAFGAGYIGMRLFRR